LVKVLSTMKRLKRLFDSLLGRGSPPVNLDAFSSSQTASKIWLVERLEECLERYNPPERGWRIWILAGWYGLTNFIIRTRAVIPVEFVRSLDLDPECQPIADRVNKFWEWQGWQFKAQTCDINKLDYSVDTPQVVINTSVEHIDTDQWFHNIPAGTIVALQANDFDHPDHVRSYKESADLLKTFPLAECHYEGSIEFSYPDKSFKRHMIIGCK
jgi:hypothetical protein